MKLALIGNGAIAHQILAYAKTARDLEIAIILDIVQSHEPGGPPVTSKLADLLATKPDLVIECAGHGAVDAHAVPVLEAGLDLLVVSIGALSDNRLREKLFAAARLAKGQLLLPAGAVAGIDGLTAAKYGGLTHVTLRSRKPPLSWGGAPGVEGIDLKSISKATAIFSGNAGEAARLFPKNANVAATIALAGLGFERTEVELIADPDAPGNVHELEAQGAFGRFKIVLENVPSPDNPKTSALTAMSIIRIIENRRASIVI
jgi:aspartate dehydrogenase